MQLRRNLMRPDARGEGGGGVVLSHSKLLTHTTCAALPSTDPPALPSGWKGGTLRYMKPTYMFYDCDKPIYQFLMLRVFP